MSRPLTTPRIRVMHNFVMRKGEGAAQRRVSVTEHDLSTLDGRLRYAMEERRTNPNQIELSTGIPRQTFYAVLRGQTQAFTYDILARVSKHLGVRPEWLARGDMPIHPAPQLKDDEEIQLIHDFRGMSAQHQRDLAKLARSWAEEDDGPTPSRPFYPPKSPRQ
jgi:hypothetical protein